MPGDGEGADEWTAAEQTRQQVGVAVRVATADLNDRERFIVENRLMADDEVRMSLVEIGRRFGVSRERARQIESSVKDKLRKRLTAVAAEHQVVIAAAA